MAEQISDYKCPACTGPLHFESTTGRMECEYCGSAYSVEEIETLYKDANAKAAEAGQQPVDWQMPEEYIAPEGMKAYKCPSCGAELVCEETTAATSCPYCGNNAIVPAQFTGMLKPDLVIPFAKNKDMAIAALKEHYKGKKLLPNSFTNQNHINEIKGVYVPFWMYDGTAEGTVLFEGEKSRKFMQGDDEITETDHYNVRRSGNMKFEKIPADASSKMPDDLMDSIEPYDYKGLKSFTQAYMTGYLADKYDETAEQNAERPISRAKASLVQALRNDVKGYDSVSTKNSDVKVTQGKIHYALMPVWLLATRWNDQNFLFAMNGQTGKLVGDLPTDNGKYWKQFFLTFVIAAAILAALTIVIPGKFDSIGTGTIALCVVVPLIIALIRGAILKGSMKSVYKATSANQYVSEGGASVTNRIDRFTHKTREVRHIDRGGKKA